MISIDQVERLILNGDEAKLLEFLREYRLVHPERLCAGCGSYMSINKYKKTIDGFAWRCATRTCSEFKKYVSIRKDTFFENFRLDIRYIIRVITKYASLQPRHSIKRSLDINKNTVTSVISALIHKMPEIDFSENKLGGPGKIVQIDETMLNYKCKSHRGRSSTNKTDALCIIEYGTEIIRAYAKVIPNKKQETIMPIICSQVLSGSTIHTDEHKSYKNLGKRGYLHGTVCHKYHFVDRVTGVHTQAIESFHNCLKGEIKNRKGIKTEDREEFLKEFCFIFNNRDKLLEAIFQLIKVDNY